ncbi:MAG: CDP-diacylglycerol--serine O-phosphatidyltransferase [bacterium]
MEERRIKEVFPGIFTFGNLLCGFISITQSFQGLFAKAAWFIVVGAFLDGLDGMVARFSGGSSRLGAELDSFSDFVTFGLAPAFLLYALSRNIIIHFNWVLPVVFTIATAYRLARYNILANLEESSKFLGLPTTAAGSFVSSFILFQNIVYGDIFIHKYMFPIIGGLSFLMVSHIRYRHFVKEIFSKGSYSRVKALIAVIVLALLLLNFQLFLFPIISLYILSGILDMILSPPKSEEEPI